MSKHEEKASYIAYVAYQSHGLPPHANGEFSMYSHDRFAKLIIEGMALQMLNDGCTVKQIKEVLACQHVRWMLDNVEDTLIDFGAELVKNAGMSDVAKEK